MKQKYKDMFKKLTDLREACEREGRGLTAEERIWAEAYMDELESSETPPDKVSLPGFDRNHRDHKGYELRTARDKKDFRSLYGSGGNDEYRWTDEDSHFFQALFSGRFHPDLTKRAMNEGVPSDGGFLVPVEQSEIIHNVSLENELVMPRATVQPMQSNEFKLPAVTIGDHSANLFGGFVASYKAEASTLAEANPKTRQMILNAKKLTGFLRMSNELIADSGSERKILDICGKGLAWYRDRAFLKGSGAGEPLGILNASCTLSQAKESGQAADTIVYENLTGMLAKLHPACFKNACWVCHQSTIPQLLQLSIAVGTGGSHIPVMTESGGGFKILTLPVIFTEKTEILGNKGDIMLTDFSQYVIGLRSEMRIDVSPHVYFTTDEAAARLIERHDGEPLWDTALTLEDGSTEVSPFVTLAERA